MAFTFDATPAAVPTQAVPTQANADPAKLRDEIHRLQQRLLRARESYDQDLFSGDAEVPLDEQLKTISAYTARLEDLTAQLQQHESGAPSAVPTQPSPGGAPERAPEPPASGPYVPTQGAGTAAPTGAQQDPAQLPQPRHAQPAASAPAPAPAPAQVAAQAQVPTPRQPIPGPGITNPDGSPLVSDGTLVRTEEQAIGEYIRFAAEQRWVASTRPGQAGGYAAVCDLLLAALAHKHGVTSDEERASLVRHVDARYRRDYG
ncbi:hypothetical protein IC607_04465 [Cellulomonas sp. JH27-2]|uniref:hypothetical protein n=1 Tax=Cellulomonas sp. JH27-2 TaxID=2774139 RepID=UPI00177D17BD|nr:hypothetical protein [Cellulomonas sp. JH27-2]MBD8058222.1 hypothetical protein [Cellulomonas sp. JH27-2]